MAARRGHRLLALLAVVALGLGVAACRPDARDRPILLIHGWAATGGTNCASTFDPLIADLRADGFTGPLVKVGFYTGDSGCDMTLRDWGSFENGSSWREVAKAFSHYVHATFTSQGQTVDVVGYSMGGNIVRGAVYGSSTGQSGFSAPIRVEDAVTLGAPHDGAAWYSALCLWGQCATLKPGAADIVWLNQDGDPQGEGGTEWTAIGSEADTVTPVDSALHMTLPDDRRVRYVDVPHTGGDNYMGDDDVVARTADSLARAGV